MKKLIVVLSILALSVPAWAATGASFPDVPEDHPNFEAVEYLDSNSIINGYDDGTFKPDALVNRAEAAKIIVGSFGIAHDGQYEVLFPDAPNDQWFFKYVMGGREAGIINGYDDGTFKPEETVNLAETLKMMILASGAELETEVTQDVYADVPSSEWYSPHALFARNNNIVFSDDEGKLNANQAMTRGAFSEVIYRMMIVKDAGFKPFPIENSWDLYKSDKIPFSVRYDSDRWELVDGNDLYDIFYHKDKDFPYSPPLGSYPNSAEFSIMHDENIVGQTTQEYFADVRGAFNWEGAEFNEFTFKGFEALEFVDAQLRRVYWYIRLDDGTFLNVFTEFGDGVLAANLQQYIKSMLKSLEYSALAETVDYTQLLSDIFANILVEGKGAEMLDQLPEKIIIDTDTIGVGTGPVDYYYSESVDHTFKYERAADVILDKREGQTAAF